MIVRGNGARHRHRVNAGFTLAEVVISISVLGLVIQGVILGYVKMGQQAEWSAYSLAAQSLASQGAEQARSSNWKPQLPQRGVGPGLPDELGLTTYTRTETLDVPVDGEPIIATNTVSITAVSLSPPVRQISSECVWRFMGRGLYTNTVIMLRAPDE
jgi:prepilin-type N-terminal cleavage/methylation domain-containing protein